MFTWRVDDEVELRLLQREDAEAVFHLIDADRERLRRWLPWVDEDRTPDDTRAFIEKALRQFAEGHGFHAGIWYRGELAGVIGLHFIDRNNRRTELGYWLAGRFEGRGIMTRACRAVVDYAFGRLGLHRVEIRCAADNHRSRAIPERLGFTQEGVLRESGYLDGRFVDMVVYGVLASEWRAGAAGERHA